MVRVRLRGVLDKVCLYKREREKEGDKEGEKERERQIDGQS